MLAAALYLGLHLGPQAVALAGGGAGGRPVSPQRKGSATAALPSPRSTSPGCWASTSATCTPLPMVPEHYVTDRLAEGWSPDDPLLRVATGVLARQAGFSQFWSRWLPALTEPTGDHRRRSRSGEGVCPRSRAGRPRRRRTSALPWTLPLHRLQAVALVGDRPHRCSHRPGRGLRNACQRADGLRSAAAARPRSPSPGLTRYRLASKVVKGQPLGGTATSGSSSSPPTSAAELAEQLHETPSDGVLLFGRFAFTVRYRWFRNWVNSHAGHRLGLAPIPAGPANLRMLRRTLALEMAYRPGGVLATKIHLKHIAVATTEGYSSRPGGAQAELLAEVNKHESDRNLDMVLAEFRNYQQGIMPAGPGARELTEFFASVDEKLEPAAAPAPRTQRSDRDVLNLLTKRAKTLHIGPANFCWFTDPSRALCLKLAGTPTADRPLVGMCDSARCPQATHHPCHRPVWAEHAERTKIFLGELGIDPQVRTRPPPGRLRPGRPRRRRDRRGPRRKR